MRWNTRAQKGQREGPRAVTTTLRAATTREVADVLSRVEFLQGVDRSVIVGWARDLEVSVLPRGEVAYRQDDPADGLHIIVTGKVKLCCHTADGREKLLEIRGPGDALGIVSALDAGPRTATASALTETCLATVDDATLEEWMLAQPQIGKHLMLLMAERLRRANSRLLDVVFDDVPCRVAKQLLSLARRFGTYEGDFWRVRHDLTQAELAQLVGATRESVNKALCDFSHRGWITTNGKSLSIHHPELLARRAG
jgi:CRP-like cAMP-binding protein